MAPSPIAGPQATAALVDRLVERVETGALELPILPTAAAEILALAQNPGSEVRELADRIQRDPSLAAHVLRVANSSLYAPVVQIASLPQAIARLGFKTMAEIALSVALKTRVFKLPGREAEIRGIFRHCAAAGAWAREIGKVRRRSADGAFLCGLLHDIGRPIAFQTIAELERELDLVLEPELAARLADRYHAEIGGRLLLAWKLPEWMVSAVDCHHHPERAGEHQDAALVACLADALSHWSLEGADGAAPAAELESHPTLAKLALYPDDLAALLARRDQVVAVAEAMA